MCVLACVRAYGWMRRQECGCEERGSGVSGMWHMGDGGERAVRCVW